MRSQRRGSEAVLYAFDLIEHDGDDLRDLPLIERKRRLARLLGRAKRRSIQFTEHLTGDGATVFAHVCRMGLEGGHRVEAGGCSLSQRAIEGVAQVEKPGERGGAPGARGGVALSPAFTVRGHRRRDEKKPPLKVGQRRLILISGHLTKRDVAGQ